MLTVLAGLNPEEFLQKSQNNFLNSSSLMPKIGCELEFFLLQQNEEPITDKRHLETIIKNLNKSLTNEFLLIYEVQKEQGTSQIEFKTNFTANLAQLCQELILARKYISSFAQNNNLKATFAAQPFDDDCGNSLQFNISLHDKDSNNIFANNSQELRQNIAKLLKYSPKMLHFFIDNIADCRRFDHNINKNLHKIGKYPAPVNFSFGNNNRTTAIRIPRVNDSLNKRIEYRLASANVNPYFAIGAILDMLSKVIDDSEIENLKPVYGNAFDESYMAIFKKITLPASCY